MQVKSSPTPSINQPINNSGGIHQNVLAHMLTRPISSLVLSGLCKISGYEILGHGTSFNGYKSIIKTGVDPKHGGETTKIYEGDTFVQTITHPDGRTEEKIYNIKETPVEELPEEIKKMLDKSLSTKAANKFYVFRDTKLGVSETGERKKNRFAAPIVKRLGPIFHSTLAYLAQYKHEGKQDSKWNMIKAFGKAFFSPKLKFIYSLEEIQGNANEKGIFKNDPDYKEEEAYYTETSIPSDRIGILGFASHFNKKHAWNHIKSNPGRTVQGIAQLGLGVLFTSVGLGLIT